jgi:signal transduction histidine kinase
MKPSPAQRDALGVFRLILLIKLGFSAAGFLTFLGLGGPARLGLLLRAAPTLLIALLVFLPWPQKVLGRSFLAAILGLDVLVESLESAPIFFDMRGFWLERLHLPIADVTPLVQSLQAQSFFFLLIPLVLLAWGYGRKGALWGAAWATVLHLGIGIVAVREEIVARPFAMGAFLPIVLLFAMPFIVSLLAERERQQHAELEAAYERLRRHAITVEQLAVSRERNRLARELHDTLAHSLSAIAVQLEALRTLLAHDPPAAQQAVAAVAAQARTGLDESRQAIQALRRDPIETMGLEGALREMVQSFEARTGVPVELSTAGQEPDLTTAEAQALYRIAEEALANVERHAAAQRVAVRLSNGNGRLDLSIEDDGAGFDPAAVDPDRYGLTGMHERAALIGATLRLHTEPGRGTEVRCSVPQ